MNQPDSQKESLRVAGVQMNLAWEKPEENFSRASALVHQAAQGGAHLVVLPEMFATGFSMDAANIAPFGEGTRDFLGKLARRHGIWLLGGYGDSGHGSSDLPGNACSLMDPSGTEVLRYYKIHPFSLAGEHESFRGGGELPSATINGVRITPLICYDLRFPEPFRAAADRTDLYLVIANWPNKRVHAWSTLLAARAIENQAFVLGVNRVGEGDGLHYSGCSALVDPLGQTIATASQQESLVVGTVEGSEVSRIRRELPFLGDRRPDVYSNL